MIKTPRAMLFAMACLAFAGAAKAQSFDETQTKAIEQIVRDYLLANPEVMIEVNEKLQAKIEARLAEQRKPLLKSLYEQETPYSVGKGDVTLVEFFDYNCGYCRKAFADVAQLLEKDKNLRVVFVDLAFFSEPGVVKASLASAKQGKYFAFHSAMNAAKGKLGEADALRIAKDVGLDIGQLKKDMNSPEVEAMIAQNEQLAQALGVDSTPAFMVGDKVIKGAMIDDVTEAVKETREKGCSVCANKS